MNHRKPPLPESWNSENGICRWCGCCIYHLRGPDKGKPNFKRWHSRCVTQYRFYFWPAITASTIGRKLGWKCQSCGAKSTQVTMELHHRIPLIDFIHHEAAPYAAWDRGNLILLCHECHLEAHTELRRRKLNDRQGKLFSEVTE